MCVFLIEGYDLCQNTGTLVYYWCVSPRCFVRKKREIQIFIGKKGQWRAEERFKYVLLPFKAMFHQKLSHYASASRYIIFEEVKRSKRGVDYENQLLQHETSFIFAVSCLSTVSVKDFEILILLLLNLSFLKSYSYESFILLHPLDFFLILHICDVTGHLFNLSVTFLSVWGHFSSLRHSMLHRCCLFKLYSGTDIQ